MEQSLLKHDDGPMAWSCAAREFVEALEVPEQKRVAEEIVNVYRSALNFLIQRATNTYVHISDVPTLTRLAAGETLFAIPGYFVRVLICPHTYGWTIKGLEPSSSKPTFKIRSISGT